MCHEQEHKPRLKITKLKSKSHKPRNTNTNPTTNLPSQPNTNPATDFSCQHNTKATSINPTPTWIVLSYMENKIPRKQNPKKTGVLVMENSTQESKH